MKNKIITRLIFLLLTLIVLSCVDSKYKQINNDLIGKWTLDSVSEPNNKTHDFKNYNTIIFLNKTDYVFEWMSGDVGNRLTGKYFILDNPKRGLVTLTMIPDIEVSGSDTIRPSYMIMDIKSFDRNRLILISETKWIDRIDSLKSIKYCEMYIYNKK